jgi:hypothetical protein
MKGLWPGAVAAAMAAGLCACQPQLEWYKEGVTPSDYKADVTYCAGARDMVAAYTPDNLYYEVPLKEIEVYNDCMFSRGYRLIEPGTDSYPYGGRGTTQGRMR